MTVISVIIRAWGTNLKKLEKRMLSREIQGRMKTVQITSLAKSKQKWRRKKEKVYLRQIRKYLEIKLCGRNLIKGINTWAVPLVRYSGLFLKWTKEELRQMDEKTRKLMTMHKAWVECLPIVWETEVQSQVKSYQRLKKWYLIHPYLTLSIIRYGSRVM